MSECDQGILLMYQDGRQKPIELVNPFPAAVVERIALLGDMPIIPTIGVSLTAQPGERWFHLQQAGESGVPTYLEVGTFYAEQSLSCGSCGKQVPYVVAERTRGELEDPDACGRCLSCHTTAVDSLFLLGEYLSIDELLFALRGPVRKNLRFGGVVRMLQATLDQDPWGNSLDILRQQLGTVGLEIELATDVPIDVIELRRYPRPHAGVVGSLQAPATTAWSSTSADPTPFRGVWTVMVA